jgi:hypothetical protein
MRALDRCSLWLAANVCGIAIFLALAVKTWIEPEQAEVPGASGGEFIVWGITALPVSLLFMAAHFVAGFRAHRELAHRNSWRGTILLLLSLGLWVAAFVFDTPITASPNVCFGSKAVISVCVNEVPVSGSAYQRGNDRDGRKADIRRRAERHSLIDRQVAPHEPVFMPSESNDN